MPRDGIYTAILWILVLNVVAGVVLALTGERMFDSPALADVGFWLAIVCAAIYLFFRIWGRRFDSGASPD